MEGVIAGEDGSEDARAQAAMSRARFLGGVGRTYVSDRSGVWRTDRSPPYTCSTKSTSSSSPVGPSDGDRVSSCLESSSAASGLSTSSALGMGTRPFDGEGVAREKFSPGRPFL